MSFIREFVRNPRQTGSIAASSDSVVRMMVDSLDLSSARRVVELGAGTGAVTEGLRKKLDSRATLIAVELNEQFAEELRRKVSSNGARSGKVHVANRSAADLTALLREHRMKNVDVISSGLPWTLMSMDEQRQTLDAVVKVLADDGQFVTLACLHQSVLTQGRRLRRMLDERFGQVRRQPVVWAAVPPMFAYFCSEPIRLPALTDSSAASKANGVKR
ncbi:MAG: class I SAM-dependent methyltransferase [Micromonosporaceae bacterium]